MVLFLFFLSALCAAGYIGAAPSECCDSKSVGGVEYTFVSEAMTSVYNCLQNCIYERVDHPGTKFCFAPGDLEVVCEDSSTTGPWTETIDVCPIKGVERVGNISGQHNASSWQKCGNICYEKKEGCRAGWTWIMDNPTEPGICYTYSTSQSFLPTPLLLETFSGDQNCPVEDCDHANYNNWWSVVSPCFKKRVENGTIYNRELCVAEPNNTMQTKVDDAVNSLRYTVNNSTELSTLATEMYLDVPDDYEEYCPGDFDSLIVYLKVVATITPVFLSQGPNYQGVPITTVLLCFLHTQKGRIFFAKPEINLHMRNIVNIYAELLDSPDSLTVLNDLQYGWMSKCAQEILEMEQFIYNETAPTWGFKSFNDFFIRNIKDINTTRPCDDGPYVLSAFGDIAAYNNQTDVKLNTTLYLKNESYSLTQIFNNDSLSTNFVGGAIFQAFFSAHKYHRYHSPVEGEIVHAEKIKGIIYAIDEVNAGAGNNFTNGENVTQQEKLDLWLKYGQDGIIDTEVYLAHVSTRCIFVINNPNIGQIGLVLIGMTEISSCTMDKSVGDMVAKGEELGKFQFGGSSGLVILQNNTVQEAAIGPNIWSHNVKDEWKMCEKIVDLAP